MLRRSMRGVFDDALGSALVLRDAIASLLRMSGEGN
jgi:hypothetical protein